MNNANIKAGVNDNLRYSKDGGVSWTDINLPEGLYEIDDINDEIYRQLELRDEAEPGRYPIYLSMNIVTQKSIIELGYMYQVDLTPPNSVATILGFKPKILGKYNTNWSENKINLQWYNQ